ncbi:MAG: DNA-binding protein [Candidatus Micrarchaeia archaeon]
MEEGGEEEYNKLIQKKLKELRKKQELEKQKKEIARVYLDAKAYERLMNVRLVNPELYDAVIALLIQLVNSQRLKSKLSEEQLIQILSQLSQKREGGIRRIEK